MTRRSLKIWSLVVLTGCGPAPVAGDAAVDRPIGADVTQGADLVLGTGQINWEPLLPAGNRLELIHGPQGGYHVFGRVRYRGLGPDVYLSFRVTPIEGGPTLTDPTDRIRLREARGLVRVADDTWETSGAQLVILTAIRGPEEVVGRTFRLQATVQRYESTESRASSAEIVIVDET